MYNTKNHNRPSQPVVEALQDAPGGLCDKCLIAAVGKTKDDAITPARRLCSMGDALSTSGKCEQCQKRRTLTKIRKAEGDVKQVVSINPEVEQFGINQLDELRRELIAYLNRLDPTSLRDGFAKRVGNLRNTHALSPTIAALMLSHGTYRNEMYYTSFKPCEAEALILKQIDAHLRAYLKSPMVKGPSNEWESR